MVAHATLELIYAYHYWMTARMLAACEPLTPAQWDQPLGHSWGSVHGLLVHMLGAEGLWLTRWRDGRSPQGLPGPEAYPALADVRRGWAEVERQLLAFLAGCDQAQLDAPLAYTNMRGQPFTNGLGELMLHVANHGTHHRGELVAMLTMLDAPHPEDDLLLYLREQRPAA